MPEQVTTPRFKRLLVAPGGSRWLPMAAAHTNTRYLWLPNTPIAPIDFHCVSLLLNHYPKALWIDAAGLEMPSNAIAGIARGTAGALANAGSRGGTAGGGGLSRGLRRAFEPDELQSLLEVAEDRGVRWRKEHPRTDAMSE